MRERLISRQFKDPTADEALSRVSPSHMEEAENLRIPAVILQPKAYSGITQTQAALCELNGIYPGERKKKTANRDPNYMILRKEILAGNLNVLNRD